MSQHIICPNCKTQIDLDKLADEKYFQKLKEQEQKLKAEQEKQREEFEKNLENEKSEWRKRVCWKKGFRRKKKSRTWVKRYARPA